MVIRGLMLFILVYVILNFIVDVFMFSTHASVSFFFLYFFRVGVQLRKYVSTYVHK